MRTKLLIAAGLLAIAATPALAQNVRNTVNSATQSLTGTVGGVSGSGAGGSQNPYAALNDTTGAGPGGTAPGGMKLKAGGKEIQIRGAVGVESGQSAVRGGAAIPF
jgi:hypothetical protein